MAIIGFNTRSIGEEQTVREAVAFAVEHGIGGVELDGRGLWQDILSPDDVHYMKVQRARHGLQYSIHFAQATAPASHDAGRRTRHLKELEETMELAHDIGARAVVVHIGRIDGASPESDGVRRESTDHAVDFLKTAVPKAEECGVVLCVENLLHRHGDVTLAYDELVDIINRVDSPVVGITLDTGHAVLTDGLDEAFEAFGPYLRHLHIHDCVDDEDHHEIGKGDLDLGRYAQVLGSAPFVLTLEVGKAAALAAEPGEDPQGVVLRSREAVKAMLGDLAQ
ncbi:MAG: sugar phosphate isomerase/epimerase [Chloroflexi bacterium]|nr:sugar phosphate isomerase/epimerase [Chloroflexota bacterium]